MDGFSSHFIGNDENESIGFNLHIFNDADEETVSCPDGSEYKCRV